MVLMYAEILYVVLFSIETELCANNVLSSFLLKAYDANEFYRNYLY